MSWRRLPSLFWRSMSSLWSGSICRPRSRAETARFGSLRRTWVRAEVEVGVWLPDFSPHGRFAIAEALVVLLLPGGEPVAEVRGGEARCPFFVAAGLLQPK